MKGKMNKVQNTCNSEHCRQAFNSFNLDIEKIYLDTLICNNDMNQASS